MLRPRMSSVLAGEASAICETYGHLRDLCLRAPVTAKEPRHAVNHDENEHYRMMLSAAASPTSPRSICDKIAGVTRDQCGGHDENDRTQRRNTARGT